MHLYSVHFVKKGDVRLRNRKSTGNVSQIKIAKFDKVQGFPVK